MTGQPSDGKWHFWIDRGGTFTDIVARDTRRPDPRAQAAVGEPRRLRRRGARGHPAVPRRASGAPIPAERIGAVKMGTTVATNALLERKGEPDAAGHHARAGGPAGDRHAGAARHFRQADRQAGDAVQPRGRGATSACAPTAPSSGRWICRRWKPSCAGRTRRRHRRGRHRLHARLRASRARAPGGGAGARARLCAGVGQPRSVAADQARDARRHDRRRRLPLARPAPLRRSRLRVRSTSGADDREPAVHGVVRRPEVGGDCSRAATRSCRARRAASSAWRRRRSSPASTASSASTWAARRPTSRTSPASTSARSRRRSPACASPCRCCAIHTVAAGGGSILSYDGTRFASGPKAPAPIRGRKATAAAAR